MKLAWSLLDDLTRHDLYNLYNLYHLLNRLHLFGLPYLAEVKAVADHYA